MYFTNLKLVANNSFISLLCFLYIILPTVKYLCVLNVNYVCDLNHDTTFLIFAVKFLIFFAITRISNNYSVMEFLC